MKLKLVSLVCTLLMIISATAFGAVTGKITGIITDGANQQPLVGVTVGVKGTSWGAITDVDGRYNILNVPVETYVLVISAIGYNSVEVSNIGVHADLATYHDQTMEVSVTDLATTISVVAETPLVIKDKTTSINIIKADEIKSMPTRGFAEVVGVQNSVVRFSQNAGIRARGGREATNTTELNLRGGRPSEVAYYVDGFSQQDPLSGNSTASIANNAIKEIQIIAGGFPAEYGHVASGIVNVITAGGGDKLSGTIEGVTDNFSKPLYDGDSYDQNFYSADLGGPIPGLDNGHFFASVERQYYGDRAPSIVSLDNGGERMRLSNNKRDLWAYQGKLNYDFTPNSKIVLTATGSRDKWQAYSHAFLFNSAHASYTEDKNFNGNVKFTHTMNKSTYFNISGSYNETERFRGDGVYKEDIMAYGRPSGNPNFDDTRLFVSFDDTSTAVVWDSLWDLDLYIDSLTNPSVYDTTFISYIVIDSITDPVLPDTTVITLPQADSTLRGVFVSSGDESTVWDDFYRRKSSYIGFNANITSEVNEYHTIKAGFQFQRHTLRYYRHLFPVQSFLGNHNGASGFQEVDRYGYDEMGNESDDEGWQNEAKNPTNWALYLQDRFEWKGMIVNAGVRFDSYDYNALELRNEELPLDPDSLRFSDPFAEGTNSLDRSDLQESKAFNKLSPRLGLAFPVSDRTQMHINYGKFFQRPDLLRLYVGYDYYEHMVRDAGYFYAFGNPNLEPEKTTAYEVGITHQLSDNTVFTATAFYKDVTGLVQIYNQSSFPNSFSSYRNSDYSTIKGMEFSFNMRRTNNITASLKYTLSYANGTGSYANTQRNIAWTNGRSPKQSAPLTFDQRHSIVGNIDFRTGKGEGPKIGDVYPLENFGANFLVTAASGTPYSPQFIYNEVTLASVSPIPDGSRNSKYGPWTFRIDMKVERFFSIGNYNFTAFVWVKNLLDRENVASVFESSGQANTTGWLNTDPGQTFLDAGGTDVDQTGYTAEEKYNIKQNDPGNYGIPRIIYAGLRFSF